MVIRKLNEITEDYQKLHGTYNELTVNYINMKKEIETMNKGQEEMKNTTSELKNTVEGIKSRLNEADDQMSELEDKVEKHIQKEQEKEKRLRQNEEGLKEKQVNRRHNNIGIIGIRGEVEEQGIQDQYEKLMMENFPNLVRQKVTQMQETQRTTIKRNPKRPTARHIIIKMRTSQDKETILKVIREKQEVTCKVVPIRLAADFPWKCSKLEENGKKYSK